MNNNSKANFLRNVRNPFNIIILMALTVNIYWIIWLYIVYSEIRARSNTVTNITPGKAVGFFFFPIANIFWYIGISVDFPLAIRRMQEIDPPTGKLLNNKLVTILMIAIAPINFIISIIIVLFVGLIQNEEGPYLLGFLIIPISYLISCLISSIPLIISQSSLNNHWQAHQSFPD